MATQRTSSIVRILYQSSNRQSHSRKIRQIQIVEFSKMITSTDTWRSLSYSDVLLPTSVCGLEPIHRVGAGDSFKEKTETIGQFQVDLTSEYRAERTSVHFDVSSFSDDIVFEILAEDWHTERGITSSLSEMILCPAYLKIIAMGSKALPLILDRLRREGDDPDHWFTALTIITCQDPVPEDARGDTVQMAKAWLSWAEKRNVW